MINIEKESERLAQDLSDTVGISIKYLENLERGMSKETAWKKANEKGIARQLFERMRSKQS